VTDAPQPVDEQPVDEQPVDEQPVDEQPVDRQASAGEARPVAGSAVGLAQLMMASDTNPYGNVHGGVLMKLTDDVAGLVAARHSGGPAVTVAIEMALTRPVHVGDLVHASGHVTWTGRTSMEVQVDVTAQRWDSSAAPHVVATAHVVYVAIGADERPRPVPPVALVTDDDRRHHAEARLRAETRAAHRVKVEQLHADTP
jgi:acyl-CoA hydrolase